MQVLLICLGDIRFFPPALNLWKYLEHMGNEVKVLTDQDTTLEPFVKKNVTVLNEDYYKKRNIVKKLFMYIRIKSKVEEYISDYYEESDSLIWIIGNDTLKFLSSSVKNKKFVMHFLELCKDISYYHKVPFLRVKLEDYFDKAYAVVSCEENRAYIMMARWKLKIKPAVIPNKPYLEDISFNSTLDPVKMPAALKNKKIILYQGYLSEERPLTEYIEAVEELGEEYVFVLMSQSPNCYPEYKNFYYIPFIVPPEHLKITKLAFIGVVTYVPTGEFFHGLNALYCAPNKIFEYSLFGVPMIGNKIPGLENTIDKFQMGKTVDVKREEIIKAILEIESGYEQYKRNAEHFYQFTDIEKIIEEQIFKSQRKTSEKV